jgi:hypothetical protein
MMGVVNTAAAQTAPLLIMMLMLLLMMGVVWLSLLQHGKLLSHRQLLPFHYQEADLM